jgi:hypothetical protein
MAQSYFPRQLPRLPLEDHAYVFPIPSSSPPSSSTNSSVQLVINQDRVDLTSTASLDDEADGDLDGEVWSWSSDAGSATTGECFVVCAPDERVNRWESLVYRRQMTRVRHSSSTSPSRHLASDLSRSFTWRKNHARVSSPSSTTSANPHPRIHIPMLSFFLSFLSLDETTLHLLTHSASQSALFAGHALSSDDSPVDCDQSHGIAKLLTLSGECHSLKKGCAVACDSSIVPSNPFLLSGRLVGLWSFVGNAFDNGGKALRDVWSCT